MPEIRIRVGAALDANVANITRPLVEAFHRARVQIQREMAGVQKATADAFRAAPAAARKAADAQVAAARDAAAKSTSIHRASVAEFIRDEERAAQAVSRVRARALDQSDRIERARGRGGSSGGRGAFQTAGETYRTLTSRARGLVGDVARGAGVNTDVSTMVANAVKLQSQAVALSNAAFEEGKGPRLNPATLMREARSIGDKYAVAPTDVMSGLQAFQAKTGELDVARLAVGGREDLAGLAEIAKATGTSFQDMIGAAGETEKALSEAFANPKERAEALLRVMPILASQGKIGSVEFSDLAKSMGKVAAGASKFVGDRAEIVAKLGALAQLAAQGGGAASAAEAASAVAGFTNTLSTPARLKKFKAEGIDVYNKQGLAKDPFELVIESLRKTCGDPERMKKLFANVVGTKPVESLAATFRTAGGGAAGEAAVRKRLDTFMKPMSQKEIHESAATALDTTESKVQRFNNNMERVAESLAARVLPQLEKLAPVALQAAEAMGKLVAFAVENPEVAITGAIVASIGKASIGDAVSKAITGAITGVGGGLGGGGGLLGGAAGGLLTAGIMAGVAAYMYTSGQTSERLAAEQKAQTSTATAIVDKPRQLINQALHDQGVNVPATAGLNEANARQFGATEAESDAIQDMLRKERDARRPGKLTGPATRGASGLPALTPEIAGAIGFGPTPQPAPAAPGAGGTASPPVAPPEMVSMLSVLQKQSATLDAIAKNTAAVQAPPQPGAPRMGPSGKITFGQAPSP